MKNKIIAGVVMLAVTGIAMYSLSTKVMEAAYSPREEVKQDAQEWAAAAKLYGMLRANRNTGVFDPKDVLEVREQVAKKIKSGSRSSLGLSWAEVGPDNVGGRTRALIIDKDDNQLLYAGGVSGGMFKSTDGANTWTRLQSFDDVGDNTIFNPAISTIVQDPNNGYLYVGTGCSFEMFDGNGHSGMMGRGVFRSKDGGETWERLENASAPVGNNNASADWTVVNRLAIDPTNSYVYAAMNKGLQRSTDFGETWESVVTAIKDDCSIKVSSTGHDVKITSDGTIVAALGGSIYYSTTGEPCSFDKSSGITGSRIALTFSKKDENYFYAFATKSDGLLKNLYKSTDKGVTWEVLQAPIKGYFELDTQRDYDVAIGANPHDENDIIVGGVELWRHDGNLYRIAAEFPSQIPGGSGYMYYVHSDKHEVVFDETDPKVVYITTDGGVAKSIDGGNTWFPANRGYNVTQFYHMAYDSDQKMMAGAQDNGTQEVTGLEYFPMSANEISGGDGFGCDYSQITDIRFASVYSQDIQRAVDDGGMGPICVGAAPGPLCGSGSFYTKIRIWETLNDPYSQSTVEFVNYNPSIGVKKGDGTTKKFKGTFTHAKNGGVFVRGGIKVFAGTPNTSSYQEVTDSVLTASTGLLHGTAGCTGTINYSTGEFEVIFATPPTETQTVWGDFETMYPLGTKIELYSNTQTTKTKIPLDYTLPANLNPGESIFVKDPVQSILAANSGQSVAITRGGLDLTQSPSWIDVPGITGTAYCIEFSKDGDVMFVGTYTGKLYRLSNLKEVYTKDDLTNKASIKQIGSFSGSVAVGVAVDPNDPDNVAVTTSGYGGTKYVYYSTNAVSASTPTFKDVTGDLPSMPCYSAIIDINNPNRVVIGTEYGVWGTDDITASSVVWTDESGELGNVPVFEIRQQTHPWEISHNTGQIYLGTHGRGMWRSSTFVGINDFKEIANKNDEFVNQLNVYPNPMSTSGYVTFNIDNAAEGIITVYDINGKRIETLPTNNFNKGDNKVQLDVTNYEAGNYFVSLEIEGTRKIAKFVVM